MRRPWGPSPVSSFMRFAAACALAMLAAWGETAWASPTGVDLLGVSPGSIRFRVAVPDPVFETLEGDPEVSRLTIRGFTSAGEDGEPALPVRIVTVAVPPTGEVRVSGSGANAEGYENVLIAAVRPGVVDDPKRIATSARDRQIPDLTSVRPTRAGEASAGARVHLAGITWMRNQRVAQIEVRPAEYDWARRRLSIDRAVDVTVDVQPAAESGPAKEEIDPFENVYRTALVNYEQGKAWRRAADEASAVLGRPGSGIDGAIAVPDTSIYAGREWVKIAIKETGFYKVDFRLLRNLSPFNGSQTTPVDSVRMFTVPGNPVLPEEGYCDACEYQEVAVRVVDGGTIGVFDNNDLDVVYFFALGPSDWGDLYDPVVDDTTFVNHPYANENFYYIGIGTVEKPFGRTVRRMTTVDGTPPVTPGGEVTPATFVAREHFEIDSPSEYWPDSYPHSRFVHATIAWEKWFWASIGRGNAFAVDFDMPGVDVSVPARLRMRAWGLTTTSKSPTMFDHFLDVSFNGVAFGQRAWNGRFQQTYDTLLANPLAAGNRLRLSVPFVIDPVPILEAQRVDQTGLAWADLFYQRRFVPVANRLTFDSSPAGGNYLYSIGPFTLAPNDRPRVFDVTDALTPIEILGAAYDETAPGSGQFQLRFRRIETEKRRYRVLPETAIVRPNNADVFTAPRSSLTNLRSATQQADYLVIYYDGFRAVADTLLRWRHERLPLQGRSAPFDTAAVPISALYDQFSGGRPDPGAIRAFLRSAFFNWRKAPAYVTILGDASYDFKNVAGFAPPGQPASLVPTYEGGIDFTLQRQFATDDWIMNVTDDAPTVPPIPDFIAGRIPVVDAVAGMTYVRDKLLPYERRPPLSEWRNRVMFIADDNEQGSRPDGLGWDHLCQTADLDSVHTPQHLDREYVYLHTYPDGPGDTKPGAKTDILRFWNEGSLLSNYIGHGSAFKIADESVFLESDVTSLRNMTLPSVFVAASCDVGKFHDPQFSGIGEKMVISSVGGCVAVISATEEAFSGQNVALNTEFYDRFTARDGVTGAYHVSLSDALLGAKIETSTFGSTNNAKYQLLGDAAVRLALPRLFAELSIEDANGQPLTQAARGQTVTFRGRVVDRPGGTLVPFNGNVGLLIEDSAPLGSLPQGARCRTFPFRAAPMFRGDVGVAGGMFTGKFIVPMNAVAGPRGKLRAYSRGLSANESFETDGVGSMAFGLTGGTAPAGDDEGPTVKLSFAGGSTSVRPDAKLKVELFDVNGILTTGHSLQNAIVVTVDDDNTSRVDISESFRYAANSYQSGTASFQLPRLSPGPHSIRVSAADNLASGIDAARHRSTATIAFEVTDSPPLAVTRTFLFPNPAHSGGMRSGGQFVVDAPGDAVNVLLRIYTISGRLIRTLKAFDGLGQVQIPWDGYDAEGYALALGTYIYQVHVNPRESDGSSSPRLKAVAEGRFVITSHEP